LADRHADLRLEVVLDFFAAGLCRDEPTTGGADGVVDCPAMQRGMRTEKAARE
jgi:hypothetical protein